MRISETAVYKICKGCESTKRSEHENFTVGEINHEEDSVDKRISQGNQSIDTANGEPVDNLIDDDFRIEDIGHDTI